MEVLFLTVFVCRLARFWNDHPDFCFASSRTSVAAADSSFGLLGQSLLVFALNGSDIEEDCDLTEIIRPSKVTTDNKTSST